MLSEIAFHHANIFKNGIKNEMEFLIIEKKKLKEKKKKIING
jgi:hypothetical protein